MLGVLGVMLCSAFFWNSTKSKYIRDLSSWRPWPGPRTNRQKPPSRRQGKAFWVPQQQSMPSASNSIFVAVSELTASR